MAPSSSEVPDGFLRVIGKDRSRWYEVKTGERTPIPDPELAATIAKYPQWEVKRGKDETGNTVFYRVKVDKKGVRQKVVVRPAKLRKVTVLHTAAATTTTTAGSEQDRSRSSKRKGDDGDDDDDDDATPSRKKDWLAVVQNRYGQNLKAETLTLSQLRVLAEHRDRPASRSSHVASGGLTWSSPADLPIARDHGGGRKHDKRDRDDTTKGRDDKRNRDEDSESEDGDDTEELTTADSDDTDEDPSGSDRDDDDNVPRPRGVRFAKTHRGSALTALPLVVAEETYTDLPVVMDTKDRRLLLQLDLRPWVRSSTFAWADHYLDQTSPAPLWLQLWCDLETGTFRAKLARSALPENPPSCAITAKRPNEAKGYPLHESPRRIAESEWLVGGAVTGQHDWPSEHRPLLQFQPNLAQPQLVNALRWPTQHLIVYVRQKESRSDREPDWEDLHVFSEPLAGVKPDRPKSSSSSKAAKEEKEPRKNRH